MSDKERYSINKKKQPEQFQNPIEKSHK